MKILWRIAIKENKNDKGLTIFSNKFGDDIVNSEQAFER